MRTEIVFIFPHQLFQNHPALSKDRLVYLLEHPRFFSDFSFHKQKLILHRASMQAYHYEIKQTYTVKYVAYNKVKTVMDQLGAKNIRTIHMADVTDHTLEKSLNTWAKKHAIKIVWYDSPQFLLSQQEVQDALGNKKSYRMHHFYVAQRKKFNILVRNGKPVGGKWSFDQENRNPFDHAECIPSLSIPKANKWVTEARIYIEKNFSTNPGQTETFIYPVTHADAKKSLHNFLRYRLKRFGVYQDAISQEEPFLYHSLLSPLLNIGLLIPTYVLEKTLTYADKHDIALNNLEGFIRQIIGWREYVRGIYMIQGKKQSSVNFFGFTKNLPRTFWSGTTGIYPVDQVIKKVKTYAYAHHIERLMVLGNIMLLSEYRPQHVYTWFMELFIDAYDWVMVPNVYGMSQFSDGGLMMTKPYISTARYILRMSDYKKNDWNELWDSLYWHFLYKHKKKLQKISRMGLVMHAMDRLDKKKAAGYRARAQKYLTS